MANFIAGNTGVRAVTAVNYTGTASGSVNSDVTGVYNIPALAAGTYNIQPVLSGYQFFPPVSAQQVIVASDISGLNFRATVVKVNGVWNKVGASPVYNTAENTGTSLRGISNPTLLYEGGAKIITPNGDGKVFKQWYCISSQRVAYAESNDCKLWTRFNTDGVLSGVTLSVCRVYHDVAGATGYYMYGGVTPWSVIKCYTSPEGDGTVWTSANATLMSASGSSNWDSTVASYFNIVDFSGGVWRALYAGGNAGGTVAGGLATGSTLTGNFTNGASALIAGIGGLGGVVKVGSTYYLFTGHGTASLPQTKLGIVSSTDLTTWSAVADIMTTQWSQEGGATGSITVPSVVESQGSVYCIYTGTDHEDTGVDYQSFLATAPMTMAQLVATTEITAAGELASDNFVRGNETPLNAPNWTLLTGIFGVSLISNVCVPHANTGDSGDYYSGVTWPANQYTECTMNAIQSGGEVRVICRTDGSGTTQNYYFVQCLGVGAGSGLKLFKIVANSFTQLGATQTVTIAIGDVIRCTADGTTISLSQNGTILVSVTDSSLATGSAGVMLAANGTNTLTSITRWAAGIPGYAISGALGAAGAGATVTYTGASYGTVTADGSGNYSIPGLATATYTITPTLAGKVFSPTSQSSAVAGAANTGVNFTTSTAAGSGNAGSLSLRRRKRRDVIS